MNVLHIINNLSKGGAERLLVEFLPRLNDAECSVTLLQLSSRDSEPSYISALENCGINVHALSSSRSVYHPLHIVALRRWLKKNKFDLVHVHLFPALYFVSIVKRLGLPGPVVFTEHSTQNKRLGKNHYKAIEKYIYRPYAKIIAITDDVKKKLDEYLDLSDKTRCIHNGIDLQKLSLMAPRSKGEFLTQRNLSPNTKLLLMTARFAFPKDHGTVVKSLGRLPENYVVLFLGEGPLLESVKQLALEENVSERVLFLGFQPDAVAFMKMVDVNIISSKYEGLSGVTLEALAAEKPVIGSDVSGINNILSETPGQLFEYGNVGQLAEKIESILADEHAQDAVNKKIVARYDMALMVEGYKNVYRQLLSQQLK